MPAITTLHRLVQSAETDAVSLAAARDILDRCGFRPAEKIEQATAIEIHVSYAEETGIVPAPGHATRRENGHSALNGV